MGWRRTTKSGQSPGVEEPMPLHIIHTIELAERAKMAKFKYLRLLIKRSVPGWGVSLWEFDVYGQPHSTS